MICKRESKKISIDVNQDPNNYRKDNNNHSLNNKPNYHKKSKTYFPPLWRLDSPLEKHPSKPVPTIMTEDILQEQSFKKNWEYFQQSIKDHISFKMMIPIAVSPLGHHMLKDGEFLVWWLKILETSQFINAKAICQRAYLKFSKELEKGQDTFYNYYKKMKNSSEHASQNAIEEEDLCQQNILKRDIFLQQNSIENNMEMMEIQVTENYREEEESHLEKHSESTEVK